MTDLRFLWPQLNLQAVSTPSNFCGGNGSSNRGNSGGDSNDR
ncbi:hypothetical protein CsSME_00014032 [Camellia sinensis var. sinensis]